MTFVEIIVNTHDIWTEKLLDICFDIECQTSIIYNRPQLKQRFCQFVSRFCEFTYLYHEFYNGFDV